MIDDFRSPARRRPKVIEPLEKPKKIAITALDDSYDDQPFVVRTEEPTDNTHWVAADSKPVVTAPENTDTASGEVESKASMDISNDAGDDKDHELEALGKVNKLDTKNKRFGLHWPPATRKQQAAYACLVLLLAFGGGATWTHFRHTKAVVADVVHTPAKKKVIPPTPLYSTLTGLPITDASINQRPVTAVMIENSPDARPQSGLDQAGVVFEAIAEGGVTRFMAVYQDSQPTYLGPVRSARPYYVQWALGFDAGYAHVGGSPDGLADIKSWNVRDLDQFYNSGAYQRISARYAPHNVYTSIGALNQVEQSKGYTNSTYTGFPRKPDAPSKTPNATSIDTTFSGFYYNSHYDYDATTNSYKRSEAGAPHMETDAAGNKVQLSPKVVISMVVPETQGALDASGAYYSNYQPIGSGQATIFQDGVATAATWSKTSNTSQLTFTDANNQPIKLNAGQTWIGAVLAANDISYK